MDNRGMAIAEGDVLVICIRVFSDVLKERYTLPEPSHSETLLSKHYAGIHARCMAMAEKFPRGHRDSRFDGLIQPQCEPALLALGHALAYSAAMDAKVPEPLLDIFEVAMVKQDPGWYSQFAGVTDEDRMIREARAVERALPHLKEYIDDLNIRQYVTAPIVTDHAWQDWMHHLKWFHHDSASSTRNLHPRL